MSRTRPPKAVRSILYIHWKLRYYPSNNPMNYLATNVTKKLDHNNSTAHGEVVAIRNAEKLLETHDLSGCKLYTTGEPCPMCLAACMWANIGKVYYGCTIADNEKIGFRDAKFDQLMGGREKLSSYLEEMDREACLDLFDTYHHMDKTLY